MVSMDLTAEPDSGYSTVQPPGPELRQQEQGKSSALVTEKSQTPKGQSRIIAEHCRDAYVHFSCPGSPLISPS